METDHKHHESGIGAGHFWWGLIAVIGIVAYFLLSEHRAHFVQYLPYLLLLACPLIHIFMHGGHGARDSDGQDKSRKGE